MNALISLPAAVAVNGSAVLSHSEVSGVTVQFSTDSKVQAPPPPDFKTAGETGNASESFWIPYAPDQEWSKADERQFAALAAKKALGKASPEERNELAQMQAQRRHARSQPSMEEVIFQYQRKQREAKVLKELQEYVEFLETARGAQAHAR